MSFASSKSAAARAWEAADGLTPDDLIEYRMPGGLSVWKLGDAVCVIESLIGQAPTKYHDLIRCRVFANLAGKCVSCGASAGVVAVGVASLRHANACPVGHPPKRLAHFIVPTATERNTP